MDPNAAHRLLARLRFRHLQLLAEVDKTGSLRAAAQQLHLTQPALSKALRELESMLELEIFRRTSRGLEPTAQGQVVIHGARVLIQELAYVQEEAQAMSQDGRANLVLRIGLPQFLAVTLLPALVSRLSGGPIPMRVMVKEANAPDLFGFLQDGRLDALLTVYSRAAVAAGEGHRLHYERFAQGDFAVVASADHPLVGQEGVSWQRLVQEPWILSSHLSLNRSLLEQSCLQAGVLPPTPRVESDSPVTSIRMVARGLGLALVPGAIMREAERAGAIRRLRVKPPVQGSSVGLVCRAAMLEHPRIANLREALAVVLAEDDTLLLTEQ